MLWCCKVSDLYIYIYIQKVLNGHFVLLNSYSVYIAVAALGQPNVTVIYDYYDDQWYKFRSALYFTVCKLYELFADIYELKIWKRCTFNSVFEILWFILHLWMLEKFENSIHTMCSTFTMLHILWAKENNGLWYVL